MKKKLMILIALIALIAVLGVVLAACNVYEWSGIGMGESSADVVSNGGYYVEQGKYVYFIRNHIGNQHSRLSQLESYSLLINVIYYKSAHR